jgi:hypothetical protein
MQRLNSEFLNDGIIRSVYFIHSTTAPVTDWVAHGTVPVLYSILRRARRYLLEIFERSLVSTATPNDYTVQAWFKKFDAVCVGCSS